MTSGIVGLGIVVASFGGAIGALYLLRYLYHQRNRSGADWFMGNIAAVALFCAAYGGALLVFAPTLRSALEAVSFVSVCFMGPFFLAFGLKYTGRGDLIRTLPFGFVAAVPIVTIVIAATNPIHHLLWTGFRFDPVFGLATVSYAIQPWGIFALLFSVGTAAVGSLLLIGAILSYGPLYRREATAVILSTVPPSVGVLVWLFDIGPIPQLHLTAPLMVIHVALDAYAFVGTNMFETNPATQRIAERTGLDSLSEPVFVLDTEGRIVALNDPAVTLFFDTASATLPVPLATVLGRDVESLRTAGELTVDGPNGKTFAVSHAPLTDPVGDAVGSMLVLYDVTEQRQREQQLAVLNRVLRHNLRNELTVISGHAEILETELSGEYATQARTIAVSSDRLLSIAEKVRDFEDVQKRGLQPESVAIASVLETTEQTCTAAHSDATLEWTVHPSKPRIHTDSVLLSTLLTNLVENAIIHSAASDPTTRISVRESSTAAGEFAFEIRDRNEPIPTHEIETLRAGDETPLQHGQGIGLWIVYWCVQKLQGEIEFDYDDGNVLTVTLPNL